MNELVAEHVEEDCMAIPAHILKVYKNATSLYTRREVNHALDKMAQEIHNALENTDPLFLCAMIGGLITTGHLLTRVDFPLEVDYVHATRYRGKTTGQDLVWKKSPCTSLNGRTVLVIDDILDGGVTLQKIVEFCKEQKVKEVYTAVLVEKQGVRLEEGLEQADFTGLTVDDHYVFGYGMDYKGYLRNAPGIFAVA